MEEREFKLQVWDIVEDRDLSNVQKLVLIAYALYDNPDDETIGRIAGINTIQVSLVRRELRDKGKLL